MINSIRIMANAFVCSCYPLVNCTILLQQLVSQCLVYRNCLLFSHYCTIPGKRELSWNGIAVALHTDPLFSPHCFIIVRPFRKLCPYCVILIAYVVLSMEICMKHRIRYGVLAGRSTTTEDLFNAKF